MFARPLFGSLLGAKIFLYSIVWEGFRRVSRGLLKDLSSRKPGVRGRSITSVHCPTERQYIPQKGYSETVFGADKRFEFCYKYWCRQKLYRVESLISSCE